ncbi:glycoside hydrolase family 5 protein [Mycena leptocephala]|nr:glycoside hydrolase family 5 protein [Mycena leptocephala]
MADGPPMQEREHASTPYSDFLPPPQPSYATENLNPSLRSSQAYSYRDDPESYPPASPNNSTALLPAGSSAPDAVADSSYDAGYGAAPGPSSAKKRRLIGLGALAGVIIIALAVVLPVYFLVVKKHNNTTAAAAAASSPTTTSASSGGDGNGSGGKPIVGAVTGGDGSTVVTANGDSFTYTNPFGGYWLADPENPFASGARPNSWTPALNESWTWGVDHVNGVNLGGWFVLEPFIAPALFQEYPSAQDEWDLSTLMRADGTLQAKMEEHYDTFITEQDIAQIAGAGLNWVRLPIPFWAVSTWSDVGVEGSGTVESEPFLEGASWKYIVRLFGWARKYGIRVNLDLHTIPGSQNGYNHSGKKGQINFLNGIMGVANAQRALDYIRIITEFISQPEYRDVVQLFGVMNEARLSIIGRPQLSAFYLQVHDMIRDITGRGAGNGPYIGVHDGFDGPIATGEDPADAGGRWPAAACNGWGGSLNTSRSQFGVTDSSTWNATVIAGVKEFALASMDALQDWFFWTWKIGKASNGIVSSPLWSYQLGLAGGWMPTDPRAAHGKCGAIGIKAAQFDGTFSAWQTGGAGAGTIAQAATEEFGVWPPATLSNVDAGALTLMPTYTATGSVPTLAYVTPTPSVTGSAAAVTPTASIGNGWFDAADTALVATPIAGCTYPAAWSALDLPAPTARC